MSYKGMATFSSTRVYHNPNADMMMSLESEEHLYSITFQDVEHRHNYVPLDRTLVERLIQKHKDTLTRIMLNVKDETRFIPLLSDTPLCNLEIAVHSEDTISLLVKHAPPSLYSVDILESDRILGREDVLKLFHRFEKLWFDRNIPWKSVAEALRTEGIKTRSITLDTHNGEEYPENWSKENQEYLLDALHQSPVTSVSLHGWTWNDMSRHHYPKLAQRLTHLITHDDVYEEVIEAVYQGLRECGGNPYLETLVFAVDHSYTPRGPRPTVPRDILYLCPSLARFASSDNSQHIYKTRAHWNT